MQFMTTRYFNPLIIFVQNEAITCLQMCCDSDSGMLYVSGGKIVSSDLCSGLYAYHTLDHRWLSLVPDQSHSPSAGYLIPRSSHVMVLHPVRCVVLLR